MKIVFTGGGTGGHFYPLIAIVESIRDIVAEQKLVAPRLYYLAPVPFDEEALFENELVFISIGAGKWRRYFSLSNILDVFRTISGFFHALYVLFTIYPDVVISKGGYASVPVVLAARIIGIPVLIHESDSKPGRANILASRFAYRIAVSFESAVAYFPEKVRARIALTGIPIRKEVAHIDAEGAAQELGLDTSVPTVFIIGGSSGSERINETVLGTLPDLVSFVNVIHQTGKADFKNVEGLAKVELSGNKDASRYHAFPYLSTQSIRRAAGAANVVVSRAGATALAELGVWGKPGILIPIPESISHDQRTNAYAYAHTGAAVVLEESNMTPHVLASEIRRIASDPALQKSMGEKGKTFMPGDAARIIAEEIVRIALTHEVTV
ncbi:MAG: UDP-N-acetylglucosamine--N-acetylmuramyl-(pentapeptide) pyrophosphoryl-undecaprenol N-acetylglucosamine transferase [Minisyncoccia bacterium]